MKALIKTSLMLVIMACTFFHAFCQDTGRTVVVSNLDNVKGTLYIGWYDEPAEFRINDKAIYREAVEDQSEVTVPFQNIPAGNYAIAVFLDENDNYELDRNLFGLPKEKYGFSNNVLPAFRPATFEESAFQVNNEQTTVPIKLK